MDEWYWQRKGCLIKQTDTGRTVAHVNVAWVDETELNDIGNRIARLPHLEKEVEQLVKQVRLLNREADQDSKNIRELKAEIVRRDVEIERLKAEYEKSLEEIFRERNADTRALRFARSVIKCGEPWTEQCEKEIGSRCQDWDLSEFP